MKFAGRASSPTHVQRSATRMNTSPFGWSSDWWHLLSFFLPQIFYWVSGTGNALARPMGTKQGPFCHNRGYSQGNKQCASHGISTAAWCRVTCYPRPGVEPSAAQMSSSSAHPWCSCELNHRACCGDCLLLQMPLDLLAYLWAHLQSLLLEPLCPGAGAENQKGLGLSSCLLHPLPHRPRQC